MTLREIKKNYSKLHILTYIKKTGMYYLKRKVVYQACDAKQHQQEVGEDKSSDCIGEFLDLSVSFGWPV